MISYNPFDNSHDVNSAIVTSLFSLMIALGTALGWIITLFNERARFKQQIEIEVQKIQNETSLKFLEIKDKYSEKLLQKRMEIYPELLKITQEIGKNNKGNKQEIRKTHETAYEELKKWQLENGGTLFMTKETYQIFKALQSNLNFEKLDSVGDLDELKIKSIWENRNELRTSLKQELNILHNSATDLTEELS